MFLNRQWLRRLCILFCVLKWCHSSSPWCSTSFCRLPSCSCPSQQGPAAIPVHRTPQMVILTFDDAVNHANYPFYQRFFPARRKNPNGCPITSTFFVSDTSTNYSMVKALYRRGHEMASHSLTHRPPVSWWSEATYEQLAEELAGQKKRLSERAQIPYEHIRGVRVPFLELAGDTLFEMLRDHNFTYDSSVMSGPYEEDNTKLPAWPYTLDTNMPPYYCDSRNCPQAQYPGFWEWPLNRWIGLNGQACSMLDSCLRPGNKSETLRFFRKNLSRHTKNRTPFGFNLHATWFQTGYYADAFDEFIDELLQDKNVYIVTVYQMIQWVRQPTVLARLHNWQPWGCGAQSPATSPTPAASPWTSTHRKTITGVDDVISGTHSKSTPAMTATITTSTTRPTTTLTTTTPARTTTFAAVIPARTSHIVYSGEHDLASISKLRNRIRNGDEIPIVEGRQSNLEPIHMQPPDAAEVQLRHGCHRAHCGPTTPHVPVTRAMPRSQSGGRKGWLRSRYDIRRAMPKTTPEPFDNTGKPAKVNGLRGKTSYRDTGREITHSSQTLSQESNWCKGPACPRHQRRSRQRPARTTPKTTPERFDTTGKPMRVNGLKGKPSYRDTDREISHPSQTLSHESNWCKGPACPRHQQRSRQRPARRHYADSSVWGPQNLVEQFLRQHRGEHGESRHPVDRRDQLKVVYYQDDHTRHMPKRTITEPSRLAGIGLKRREATEDTRWPERTTARNLSPLHELSQGRSYQGDSKPDIPTVPGRAVRLQTQRPSPVDQINNFTKPPFITKLREFSADTPHVVPGHSLSYMLKSSGVLLISCVISVVFAR